MSLKTNLPTAAGIATVSYVDSTRPSLHISNSSGTFTTTSTSPVNVTNLSVNLTTTGRPVSLFLINDGSNTGNSYIGGDGNSSNIQSVGILILRNGSEIAREVFEITQASGAFVSFKIPVGSLRYTDVPSAGSNTYTIQIFSLNAANVSIIRAKLVAYEM